MITCPNNSDSLLLTSSTRSEGLHNSICSVSILTLHTSDLPYHATKPGDFKTGAASNHRICEEKQSDCSLRPLTATVGSYHLEAVARVGCVGRYGGADVDQATVWGV